MTPKAKRIAAAASIATAIAIPAEGLRQYAYYDPPGVLTVCYGSTKNVVKGKKYSMEECEARLDSDMQAAIATVERCVPDLPIHVLAAFGDAVYNLGPTIVCDTKNSTAARMLKANDLQGACNQLPRWDKAKVMGVYITLPGLTKRRGEEQTVCLAGVV
jgi:GH24 family phage-related lysozyme (muramidase)